MCPMTLRRWRVLMTSLLLAALILVPDAGAAQAASTTFSGEGTVVGGQVEGIQVGPLADTGPVDSGGGALEASLLKYPVTGLPDPSNGALKAEVLHASTVAHGNQSRADASVA